MTLNIDLTDPAVQRQLGARPTMGNRKPVVQLAGDAPDPSGMTRHIGAQSTTRLTSGKQEVVVVYKDMFLTVDVYQVTGEPMKVHLYCPRCHKHATVPGDRKAIDYDPTAPNPQRTEILASGRPELMDLADFGRLSIDTFECPWELGDEKHVQGAVQVGTSLCRLRIAIDRNRVRDA